MYRYCDGFPRCLGRSDYFTAARHKYPDQPAHGTTTQPTTRHHQTITTSRVRHQQPGPTPTGSNPTAPNVAAHDENDLGAPADTNHSPSPNSTTGHHIRQDSHNIHIHTHFRTLKHASLTSTNQDRTDTTYYQSLDHTVTRTTTSPHTSQALRAATPHMAAAHFLSSITLTHRQTLSSPHPTLQISLTTHRQQATSYCHTTPT